MVKMNEAKASQIKKILADKDVIEAVMSALEGIYGGFVPFGLTDAKKAKLMAAVFDPTKDVAFDTCDTEDLDKLKAKYAKKGYKVLYELYNMDSAALALVKNTALKESSDGRLPEGIAARSWQYDKDERVAKAFFKAQDADRRADFTEFVKKFSADYGISLFSLRSALNKCFECPSSEFYEYDHCAFCASCVDEMIRKTSAVREGTLAKGRQRIREGIISSKDGDKTFDQLYGDGGVQLDEADEEWAQAFARCFESTKESRPKRLRESYEESPVATQDYARCEERIIDIVDDLTENPRNPAKASSKKYADNEVGQGWSIKEIWQDITGAGNWQEFVDYLKAKNSELLDFIREEDLV